MRVGGNCLKYLKRGWNRKPGRGYKDFKKMGARWGKEWVPGRGDWNPVINCVRFSWHKGAWPCWKVKHSQNLVVRFNFSLLISFEHNASLQITKTSINPVLLWYLFVLFCSPDIWVYNCSSVSISRFGQLCQVTILSSNKNTELEKQI